jgi:hypothetical protein
MASIAGSRLARCMCERRVVQALKFARQHLQVETPTLLARHFVHVGYQGQFPKPFLRMQRLQVLVFLNLRQIAEPQIQHRESWNAMNRDQ